MVAVATRSSIPRFSVPSQRTTNHPLTASASILIYSNHAAWAPFPPSPWLTPTFLAFEDLRPVLPITTLSRSPSLPQKNPSTRYSTSYLLASLPSLALVPDGCCSFSIHRQEKALLDRPSTPSSGRCSP